VRRRPICGGVCEESQLRLVLVFTGCGMCEVGGVGGGRGEGEVVLPSCAQELFQLGVWGGALRGRGRVEVFATNAGGVRTELFGAAPERNYRFALDSSDMAATSRVHAMATLGRKRPAARPDVRPGDRQVLASRPVHTLDAIVSGDARSNLISSPNRGRPCTLHDSTSKTVSEMPRAPSGTLHARPAASTQPRQWRESQEARPGCSRRCWGQMGAGFDEARPGWRQQPRPPTRVAV
jgi:hypothetical protein